MAIDPWLPVGHRLPDGTEIRKAIAAGTAWQIAETAGDGRVLLASDELASRWAGSGIIEDGALGSLVFGSRVYRFLAAGPSGLLAPVTDCRSPSTKPEALAFAMALKATRQADTESPLHDAIYVEPLSRLLPTYSISQRTPDDVVLGTWLTGGAQVSTHSFRRLSHMLSWLPPPHLKAVIEAAGCADAATPDPDTTNGSPEGEQQAGLASGTAFTLPGRPKIEEFINEHVVDLLRHSERYKALGIDFPSAIVLHGPTGCGKTFAAEKLIEFLGWPSFAMDASSVASPYIHETSRKVAAVFRQAIDSAPSVLVIDEMEAFLADRDLGTATSHHRVEEVAEFLRRIPEATKRHVLIVAMTNKIDIIDPAILRRGRFDHVIEMGYPEEEEVKALLDMLLSGMPKEEGIDCANLAARLAGRPLSDAAFVVREGARLAARAGRSALDAASLEAALASAPSRTGDSGPRIGFEIG